MINSFSKFAGYITVKWLMFYAYQFLGTGNKWNQTINYEGRILAAFVLLALPILEVIVLFFPFQLALKQKGWLVLLMIILIFLIEFAIGWFATNQKFEIWMAIKIVLSVILFMFFYRKQLNV